MKQSKLSVCRPLSRNIHVSVPMIFFPLQCSHAVRPEVFERNGDLELRLNITRMVKEEATPCERQVSGPSNFRGPWSPFR